MFVSAKFMYNSTDVFTAQQNICDRAFFTKIVNGRKSLTILAIKASS